MCIFSYDGTDRIRFTGQGYKALSQPDASGPPKMDHYAICVYYSTTFVNVKPFLKKEACHQECGNVDGTPSDLHPVRNY